MLLSRALRECLVGVLLAQGAMAQPAQEGAVEEQSAAEEDEGRFRFEIEGKAHYRHSQELRIPSPLPPPFLPPGVERVFLETVNQGDHVEISVLTLFAEAQLGRGFEARAKVDFLELYDRNPTSEGDEVDIDELWVRFGGESAPAEMPEGSGAYLKAGKFPKYERQDDRHLETYGLVSTAFNRFADVGVELGADLGRHLYVKASVTQGNPVFFRDPNALAGDNGTPIFSEQAVPNPELKSGFPILYDAKVTDLDADGDVEVGVGLGVRFGDGSGTRGGDVLVWGYQRDLAQEVDLEGTFYGGDLDLLLGPRDLLPLPVSDDEKQEVGANLWLYFGGFSLFAQAVDQELAGMDRRGGEIELAWSFDLPVRWSVAGRQLFPYVQPAVRFSRLDPDFDGGSPGFPAPSVRWEWDKIDVGLRVGLLPRVDLTAEWVYNDLQLATRKESLEEVLVTLRFRGPF